MLQTISNGRPTGPIVQKIVDLVKAGTEGDVIKHDTLEAIVGFRRSENRYRSCIQAAKKRILNELGYSLLPMLGVGYKIPTGIEQFRHGVRTVAAGVRRISQGVKITNVITDKRLPDPTHRTARDHVLGQMKYLSELARTKKKEMSLIVGKPEALPR